ncbi:MAG: NDP-sugar synthase [Candidatus Saganbacteria bacterium]|nr:NDP-sugar synthase [Candidatus Saganbacteria bacterium]
MIGFILAAGHGSRLYPLTLDKPNSVSLEKKLPPDHFNINARPKPLAPVTNCPMISSSLKMMNSLGVDKIFIIAGKWHDAFARHLPSAGPAEVVIRRDIRSNPFWDIKRMAEEEMAKGFRGSVVVLSGDIVSNIDPRPILEYHQGENATATIASTPITDDIRSCSPIALENPGQKSGRVIDYRHKLAQAEALALSSHRNSSVYFFETDFFDLVRDKFGERPLDLSADIFPWLAGSRAAKFMGYATDDLWSDIGEPDYYLNAQRLALEKRLAFPCLGDFYPAGRTYRIGNHRIAGPSVIGNNCDIGAGSLLGPYAVIGSGWTVGANSRITRSVLWPADAGLLSHPEYFSVGAGVSVTNCAAGSGRLEQDAADQIIVHNGSATIRRNIL